MPYQLQDLSRPSLVLLVTGSSGGFLPCRYSCRRYWLGDGRTEKLEEEEIGFGATGRLNKQTRVMIRELEKLSLEDEEGKAGVIAQSRLHECYRGVHA
jgi:hypothetical protein